MERRGGGDRLFHPGAGVRAEQIRSLPLIGWLAGRAFRLYREGSVTSIKTGAGKGLLWKRSRRFQSGFYLGTYEPAVQEFLAERLSEGSVFWDVGANAGFFSVIAGRLVGREGQVVAFEPFPENAQSVTEQIALNGMEATCQVVEAAVSTSDGWACLDTTGHNAMHRLDPDGELEVRTLSLDSVLERGTGQRRPDVIKVDVEGAELAVLGGAGRLLELSPVWLVEAHGQDNEVKVRSLFSGKGYVVEVVENEDSGDKILLTAQRQAAPEG